VTETPGNPEPEAARGETDLSIVTLGCRLNAYESEVMRQHALDAGLGPAVVVNTCAVTAEAVRQAAQAIRRVRRDRPEARIIVTGCAAQIEPRRFAGMAEVDHVIGNAEKMRAATFRDLAAGTAARLQVDDIAGAKEAAHRLLDGFGGRARAFVEIQNGCDHRCTFCVIPLGRGPSRSVPAGDVVARVRRLVESGAGEVVVTGVDLTSWGRDLPGAPTLGRLVRQILRHVPELRRLRLTSIDQVEADRHLLDAIAEEPRLMPHLHLSMQAGDDLILKRMKRRHLRHDAIRFCHEARRLRPDIVFGADLIAGFPTESEDMFAGTLDIVDACGLTYLHVFPYSPRAGTPAARMPQVPRAEVKDRARRLREKGARALRAFFAAQTGGEVEAMMETSRMGRTPHYAEIKLDRDYPAGAIARARVTGHEARWLVGEARA